ncbi:MAG: glycosyltransferase, partial [Candidatus Izemoplasmatales bacterium]|nr:glycosyltransferase [Candidatus Izemoplasmatales bacterium]
IESVVGSRRFYQSRVIEILKSEIHACIHYLYGLRSRNEIEIKELFIELADSTYSDEFSKALLDELHAVEDHISGNINPIYQKMPVRRFKRYYLQLLKVLSNSYHFNLNNSMYLENKDTDVIILAIQQISHKIDIETIHVILAIREAPELINAKVEALLRIIDIEPQIYLILIKEMCSGLIPLNHGVVARLLVERIDYLFLKLFSESNDRFQRMLKFIVSQGFSADLIGFLNRFAQPEVVEKALSLIESVALENPEFYKQLTWYLRKDLFKRTNLPMVNFPVPSKQKSKPEARKTKWLLRILAFILLIFPTIFLIFTPFSIFSEPWTEILSRFVLTINYTFIAYYMLLNFVYIVLAIISARGAQKQKKLWSIKNSDMLNQKGMLSSISIIAPAYNEELSIVQSVQSLLSLNYPDFEVVVVNDGSKDRTLEVLINHFELERRNIHITESLNTRPIQGVYLNKEIPNLIVVDKLNGGKADALNVGINVAKNLYVCGIDADSLLAPDSLLRLMSSMLDYDDITLAIGGNIYPINGGIVSNGQVESLRLPRNLVASFQALEYLRAFNLGRTAFSELKGLLIISGAFGLFEKQILTEVGGYMTSSTLQKDTVGEDMELVVRITRRAYDTKLRFRISYINHANCYTEVPESAKILQKQRNRWQRGLIDILSYHRQMLFNAKYKQVGMVVMPFFFMFEMVGPVLEVFGYLALFIGIFLGITSVEIVLLLMSVSILLGMIFSLFALLVTESETEYISIKDTIRLIFLAVIENFGWRQYVGIYRGVSYFSALRENHEWGQMNRVGFQVKAANKPQ